jgi:hypothetical protein
MNDGGHILILVFRNLSRCLFGLQYLFFILITLSTLALNNRLWHPHDLLSHPISLLLILVSGLVNGKLGLD